MRRQGRWRLAATLAGVTLAGALALSGSGAQADHLVDDGLHMSEVAQIDTGWWYSCAVTHDGELYCWGGNTTGQLGDPAVGARPLPARVNGFDGARVRQVSTGPEHACAVTTTGQVWCWGLSMNGRLGLAAQLAYVQPVPRRVTNGVMDKTFVTVSAGKAHTCALETNGTPWCWGDNYHGQLGDGANVERVTPQRVDTSGMGMVRDISAGHGFTCAISTQGIAWCWGDNDNGKLGDGTETSRNRPVRVSQANGFPSDGIADVDAGNAHACAATNGRIVYCWGDDGWGRVGAGQSSSVYLVPQRVRMAGGADFEASAVSAGAEVTCAVRASGQAWCWGNTLIGQLGDNTLPLPNLQQSRPRYPVNDKTLTGQPTGRILQISAGANHSCSVNEGGRAFCWGGNHLGQLGDSTFGAHRSPSAVFAPPA